MTCSQADYPCTLQPPLGYQFIRLASSKELSIHKKERINRFYQFEIDDDVQLFPCSLIQLVPRNLESVMKEFFEQDILYIDERFERRAQREFLFTPQMPDIPCCVMSVWDFVAEYFDFNVIIDRQLQETLSKFIKDEREKQQFLAMPESVLLSNRFRVVDMFRMCKSSKISIADFSQMPRLHPRTFALCSYNKCELLIQDIQEMHEDPVTNVSTQIFGVTSGSFREVASFLGNALKPYLDRQGLFAAKFLESPINGLIECKKDITALCIGAGYGALRPLLQYRKIRDIDYTVNLFISLRQRDDLGFLRNELEELELSGWFHLYYIDSGNDIEYGKSQLELAILQEKQCFHENVQLCYCGKEKAMNDLKESVFGAMKGNLLSDDECSKIWDELVQYTWINH